MRRTSLLGGALLVVLLAAGAAKYIADVQASARDKLRDDFAQRAVLASQLTGDVLTAGSPGLKAFANQAFGGPGATVQRAVDSDRRDDPQARILVLGGDDRVLGAYPRSLRRGSSALADQPEIARARAGRTAYSDVLYTREGQVVMVAVPFGVPDGRRVWSSSVPLEEVSALASGYLSTALDVAGGFALLVDAGGRTIASSKRRRAGAPLLSRALRRALRANSEGVVGERYYVSARVPSTSWQVVFSASQETLLAPARSTEPVAWQLFGAFVLAMACLLGSGAAALKRSARLAHERLHDALTGLPNRTLFIDRTQQALAVARRGGLVVVFFIDLDGFKRINDVFGHVAGDALLEAVSARLRQAVRPGDSLSRFGGDEFLILCSDLQDEGQANRMARRIQAELARPFEVDGKNRTVGCSIGLAFHHPDDGPTDADTLIHNADLAMYRAKQQGRARVEIFGPGCIPASA